jgi:hypothetical protein
LEPSKNSEIEETAWRDWLEKNRVQDRFRYERRLRVAVLIAIFITLIALLWRFAA